MDTSATPDPILPPSEMPDLSQPRPRGWNLLAWSIILAAVGLFLVGRDWLFDQHQAADAQQERRLRLAVLEVQARYLVGVGDMMGLPGKDLFQQAQSLDDGQPDAALRLSILAGEFLGPAAAAQRLWQVKPTTPREERAREILFKVYLDQERAEFDYPSLSREDRAFLREEFGWFGRLALHPRGVRLGEGPLTAAVGAPAALAVDRHRPDPSARQETMEPAHRVVTVILGGLCTMGTLAFGGLVGLIILIVLSCRGKLPSGLAKPVGHGGVYAETFTLWLLLYFGGVFFWGHLLLPQAPLLVRHGLASLLSLSALAWPWLRGVSWQQVQQDIGLNLGSSPAAEPGWGILGYAMTLPLLAVGAFLTILLILVQRKFQGEPPLFGAPSDPTHPIVELLIHGDAGTRWQVFFLVCVEAPFVEEIMFRGVLYRNAREMTRKVGSAWSFVISGLLVSFVFAAIHPQGWTAIPALMSLALGFSMLREWRGSLVAPMVAHGINNGLVFGVILLAFGG